MACCSGKGCSVIIAISHVVATAVLLAFIIAQFLTSFAFLPDEEDEKWGGERWLTIATTYFPHFLIHVIPLGLLWLAHCAQLLAVLLCKSHPLLLLPGIVASIFEIRYLIGIIIDAVHTAISIGTQPQRQNALTNASASTRIVNDAFIDCATATGSEVELCSTAEEARIVRLTPSLCLLGGYTGLILLLLVSVISQSSRFSHLMLVQQMSEKTCALKASAVQLALLCCQCVEFLLALFLLMKVESSDLTNQQIKYGVGIGISALAALAVLPQIWSIDAGSKCSAVLATVLLICDMIYLAVTAAWECVNAIGTRRWTDAAWIFAVFWRPVLVLIEIAVLIATIAAISSGVCRRRQRGIMAK